MKEQEIIDNLTEGNYICDNSPHRYNGLLGYKWTARTLTGRYITGVTPKNQGREEAEKKANKASSLDY